MKASELRIGNLIMGMDMVQTVFEILDNTDRGRIVHLGYEHLILVKENGNQYKPIEVHPIPLTEEWLLKFGFNYQKADVSSFYPFYVKSGFRINEEGYHWYVQTHCVHIQYVHQLQNLYFALTGEELR